MKPGLDRDVLLVLLLSRLNPPITFTEREVDEAFLMVTQGKFPNVVATRMMHPPHEVTIQSVTPPAETVPSTATHQGPRDRPRTSAARSSTHDHHVRA